MWKPVGIYLIFSSTSFHLSFSVDCIEKLNFTFQITGDEHIWNVLRAANANISFNAYVFCLQYVC